MIKINGLSKVFRTDEVETMALNDIEFKADRGEFVAVMGPSGCGKSTPLNIIGLLDHPSGGEYYFMDKEVSDYKESQRNDLRKGNIGFIFQSFNLIDELTLFENVEMPLLYLKMSAKERRQKVNDVLERMQMFDGKIISENIKK
jgi:putative ABC transport system ATP-binding protein